MYAAKRGRCPASLCLPLSHTIRIPRMGFWGSNSVTFMPLPRWIRIDGANRGIHCTDRSYGTAPRPGARALRHEAASPAPNCKCLDVQSSSRLAVASIVKEALLGAASLMLPVPALWLHRYPSDLIASATWAFAHDCLNAQCSSDVFAARHFPKWYGVTARLAI